MDVTNSTKSRLLALPGEIRNLIYRFVVHEDQPILITARGYARTNLLLANRQIHSEIWKIALLENGYQIDIRDYNTDALHKWTVTTKNLIACNTPPGESYIDLPFVDGARWLIHQIPHWRNFKTFLRRVHADELELRCIFPADIPSLAANSFGVGPLELQELYVIGALCRTVLMMKWMPRKARKQRERLSWREVAMVVDAQRGVLHSIKTRWGRNDLP